MKVLFMGTPQFSVPALKALIDHGHDVVAVYTRPPKPSGRGHKRTKSPVHSLADHYNIPVYTPKSLRKPDAITEFKSHQVDLAIVAAYGLILPNDILMAPTFGCINIHASLLPRWRGAAPIQRAIEAGDAKTGITLMQMDEGLDTGDMLAQDAFAITPTMTSQEAHDIMSQMGARLLIDLLKNHPHLTPQKQPETDVTYAYKLEKSESCLDFSLSAEELDRKIRAFLPWPGTHFYWQNQPVKVIKATPAPDSKITLSESFSPGQVVVSQRTLFIGCQNGALQIHSLHPPGKKPMDATSFINGYGLKSGMMVNQPPPIVPYSPSS